MAKAEMDLWVSRTFSIDLTAYPAPAQAREAPEQMQALADSPADGGQTVKALKLPKIPKIPGVPDPSDLLDDVVDELDKDLNGPFTCNGKIQNSTKDVLFLDLSSVKSCFEGEYTSMPPGKIAAGESGEFTAEGTAAVPVPILSHFTRTGAEGAVRYFVGEGKLTVCTMYFNVPRVGKNKTEGDHGKCSLEGDKASDIQYLFKPGSGNVATFNYVLSDNSSPDKPNGETPAGGAAASCLVTVTNSTKQVLFLRQQGHVNGDFTTFPPSTLQPGDSRQFVSVHTPGGKQPGCKGFAMFEIGEPALGTWRVGWDNEVGAQNTTAVNLDPASAGFKSLDQIGQGDENVPVAFTLSGGAAPVDPVHPVDPVDPVHPVDPVDPVKPPEPEPAFDPPAKPGQPTLRKGDKNDDGWVEYAQQSLNFQLKTNLKVDGNFGNGTLAAVHKFQQLKKLQDDGVIGNETWAALRNGAPEKPSTDGRKPHSFEEKGKQGRFTTEGSSALRYNASDDSLTLRIVSVGEEPIDGSKVTMRVTQPDGTKKAFAGPIGPVDGKTPDGQGELHTFEVAKFTQVFGIKDKATIGQCVVDAYLEKEIGGDVFHGSPTMQ